MRKKLYIFFWAWEFDKEEEWLNQMAVKGLALVSVGFCNYNFEESLPGEYKVRLELLTGFPTQPENEVYLKFVEGTGAEYLGSLMRWAYFRKKTQMGDFEIFSDNASRIRHLNRILALLGTVAVMEFVIGFSNLSSYFFTNNSFTLGSCILVFALGLLISWGVIKVYRKKRKLQRDAQLFE